MSKKHRKRASKQQTALAVTAPQQTRPSAEFQRAERAVRSFYSNAVSWGNNLLTDARDEYSIDDATAARLYAINVTAWACAQYRSLVEGGIPAQVVDESKTVVESDDNPIVWFFDNRIALMTQISLSVSIWGKFFLRKIRNQRGLYTRLERLSPMDVSPAIDYERNEFLGFRVRGRDVMIAPHEMITAMNYDPLNDFDGVSSYEVAMRQIVAGRELVRFAQKYFQDGTMLGGMLTYEGDLSDDEYLRTKNEFEQFKGSQNAFKTFIAGGGIAKFDYKPMQPNPVDLAMPDLKELLDTDTCRAFFVHPVLVGVLNAKDPLSAQSTYDQIERTFITTHAVPRNNWIFEAMTQQWLQVDFAAWGKLKLESDVSEITAASKSVPERSQVAVGNAGRIWTLDEAREYTGQQPLPIKTVQINPDWATVAFKEGGLKLSEYRLAIGYKPDPTRDGYVYEVDPRASGQQSQLSFNMGGNPPPSQIAAPPAPKALPATVPSRAETACYVILSLANDPVLLDIQNTIKAHYPAVDWTPAKDFHVTLVHTPVATDLATIKAVLPKSIHPITLTVGELDTFDGQARRPLILRVAPEQMLVALQRGLFAAFEALGLPMSPYSLPEDWQPHITLGYLLDDAPPPTWDRQAVVSSSTLICSIESGGGFQSIAVTRSREDILEAELLPVSPMRADPLLTKAQLFELDNWQKKVKHKGIDAAFESKHLPDPLATFIRSELAGLWNPRSVFEEAKRAIRQGRQPNAVGATPEEAAAYWRDFDNLQTDLGSAFLDYMQRVSPQIFEAAVQNHQAPLDELLSKGHTALIDAWVGTPGQPGPLLKLTLAGMEAGDKSLEREVSANPRKPIRAYTMGVSWDLLSQHAATYSNSYAMELIRNIDDTTKAGIRDALQQQISGQLSGDALRDLIAQVLVPPGGQITDAIRNRAATIGESESVAVYNAGAFQRWRDAGVNEATWQTTRDDRVCPICRPLHGVRARISDGWVSPTNGERYTNRCHARGRCFRRPVVE